MNNVLIIVDTSRNTGRELLVGVEKYISAFTDWQVHTLSPDYLTDDFDNKINQWDLNNYDGFFICNAKNISRFINLDKPKVIHYTPDENLNCPSRIITNSSKIGTIAAEYYIRLGFKNFAFCGFKNIKWSNQRFVSYRERLNKFGIYNIEKYSDTPSLNSDNQARLDEWIMGLEKPIAVFGCNDDRAIYVLQACKRCGINVPEQVAVLGVDNDPLICNLSAPPLSSIKLDFEKAGYQAAKQLDMLMKKSVDAKIITVDPNNVITRRSSDILAVNDEDLAAAIIFIRENYKKSIGVGDVVNATGISRRELEYRFRQHLKMSIKQQIDLQRAEYIKTMLANSSEPIYKIAEKLKFTDPQHFSRYFKNLAGIEPTKYRQSHV